MFVILLDYVEPLEAIDAAMKEHVAFLERCYAAGVFLVSGRRVPREGGVILAVAPNREDLDEIMAHDPFIVRRLARYEIVEFRTSLHHPALAAFADPKTRPAREVPDS